MQQVDGAPVDYSRLPVDHQETARLYIEHGCQPGSGWMAILSNTLDAVVIVDNDTCAQLPAIYRWLVNRAPSNCWGSRDKVLAWMAARRAERRAA